MSADCKIFGESTRLFCFKYYVRDYLKKTKHG